MTETRSVSDTRVERILAYMVAACIAVSIIAFLAVIVGTAVGAGADDGFSRGAWPVVIMLPWFGLPIGFLLLLALLITSLVRRKREAAANDAAAGRKR